jgi:hypothetical protein
MAAGTSRCATMSRVDDELQAELNALRGAKAEQQRKHDEEQRAGRGRLRQFVEEMQGHGIRPFPLVAPKEIVVPGTPGQPRGLFRKPGPPGPSKRVKRYKIVDHGWPIGWPNKDGGPDGERDSPVITERGVIYNVFWSNYNEAHFKRLDEEIDPSAIIRLEDYGRTGRKEWVHIHIFDRQIAELRAPR